MDTVIIFIDQTTSVALELLQRVFTTPPLSHFKVRFVEAPHHPETDDISSYASENAFFIFTSVSQVTSLFAYQITFHFGYGLFLLNSHEVTPTLEQQFDQWGMPFFCANELSDRPLARVIYNIFKVQQGIVTCSLTNTIRDINASLLQKAVNTDAIHHKVLVALAGLLPLANIYVCRIYGETLKIKACYREGVISDNCSIDKLPFDKAVISTMVASEQLIYTPGALHDPLTKQIPAFPSDIAVFALVPIQIFGQLMGCIAITATDQSHVAPRLLSCMRVLAAQIALGMQLFNIYNRMDWDVANLDLLDHASTFLHTSLTNANSLQGIGELIATAVTREIGQVDCGVMLIDLDNTNIRRIVRKGTYEVKAYSTLTLDGPGLVPAAMRVGHYIYAPDVSLSSDYIVDDTRTCSELVIPLVTSYGAIGALDLQSMEKNAFTQGQIDLLVAFADHAASAIATVIYYEQLRTYTNELEEKVYSRTRELEDERSLLRSVLRSLQDTVIYWEYPEGSDVTEVRYINRAGEQLFGARLKRNQLSNVLELIISPSEQERLSFLWKTYILRGDSLYIETQLTHPDGSIVEAAVSNNVFYLSDGKTLAGVTVIRDISQEKASKEQRERFIANASHELRTPLAGLKIRQYLLRRQPEKMAEHLTLMEQITNRMQQLVDTLLDLSRYERGLLTLTRSEVVLQNIILQAVEFQKPSVDSKQISLMLHLSHQPIIVSVDEMRIHQVITNLLVNAVNYTPAGGTIHIVMRTAQHEVYISIVDNGCGIPTYALNNIFKPFYRINEQSQGTGLGLPISQEIMRLHGGSITVESREGVGSIFTIRLPRQEQPVLEGRTIF